MGTHGSKHRMLAESPGQSRHSSMEVLVDFTEVRWLVSLDIWSYTVDPKMLSSRRVWIKKQHVIPMRVDLDSTLSAVRFTGEAYLVCDRFVAGTGSNVIKLPENWSRIIARVFRTTRDRYEERSLEGAVEVLC